MKVCFLLATCTAAALTLTNADEYFTGEGTAYTLGQSSAGNCNMMSALDFATTDYAALNDQQWEGLQNCGRCAEVSCADDRCADQSKSIVVQILDRCPECKHGDLDLSPTVFTALTGSTPSRYSVKWKFVDCPVSGNVNYCLKGGSNNYWTAVQPTNVATGIKNLQINGQDTTMLGSAYYYLLDGVSESQTDLSSMTISMTDVNGNSIEDTVSLTADSCTEGANQFPAGGSTQTYQQSTPTIKSPRPTTLAPTTAPTQAPTTAPTQAPTTASTQAPTTAPTQVPTPSPMPTPTTQTPSPAKVRLATTAPATYTPQKQEILPTAVPVTTTAALTMTPLRTPAPYASPTTAAPIPTTTAVSSTTAPPTTALPTIVPTLPTKQEPEPASSDNDAKQIFQQIFNVTSAVGLKSSPSPKKTLKSKISTNTYTSSALIDNDLVQQTQQKPGLPAATAAAPSTNTEQIADSQAAEQATTKSGETSSGTDPLIIILSTLGAVGMVALIVVVVIAKRKNIQEQKARDVEMPSMISARSFDMPLDRRHVFAIL